jgi:hypothetical protein
LYEAAKKGGDTDAALAVIDSVVDFDMLDRIVEFSPSVTARKPVLVAPTSAEASGTNALPLAYALWLGQELGYDVCSTLYQYRGVKRDFCGAWHRLAFPTRLHGHIEEGADFILVDDVCTLGGTLSEIAGFIVECGGRVIGSTCLASSDGGHVQLALSRKTEYALKEQFGDELSALWTEEFGYDTRCLTEPEASFLLRNGRNVGHIRDAIHRARSAGDAH